MIFLLTCCEWSELLKTFFFCGSSNIYYRRGKWAMLWIKSVVVRHQWNYLYRVLKMRTAFKIKFFNNLINFFYFDLKHFDSYQLLRNLSSNFYILSECYPVYLSVYRVLSFFTYLENQQIDIEELVVQEIYLKY